MTAGATPSILTKGFIWVFVLLSADTGHESVKSVVKEEKARGQASTVEGNCQTSGASRTDVRMFGGIR